MAAAALAGVADIAAAEGCGTDVAAAQAVNSASVLIDGQPGVAGQPTLSVSGSTGGGATQAGATWQFTPGRGALTCNTLLSVGTPGVTLVGDRVEVERNADLTWLQRWRIDDRRGPSLSTILNLEIPIDDPLQKPQLTAVVVAARSIGANVVYLNLLGEGPDRRGERAWRGGALLGWKRSFGARGALVIDGGLQPGGDALIEVGWMFSLTPDVTLGPGVAWSEGGVVNVGVVLQRTFGGVR